jgi:hypothetical protein
MKNRAILAGLAVILAAVSARADGPKLALPKVDAGTAQGLLGDKSPDALAGSLRGFLVRNLPPTLYEDNRHWGQQAEVAHGVRWKGQGLHVHPEVTYALKNHGRWWRAKVTADNLPDTLIFDLRDFAQPEPGRLTFTVHVALDVGIEYERQTWEAGTRLYSGSVRARARVKLTLPCEASARIETDGKWLPDAVLRLHVTGSDFSYDHFVVEHVAGVGGDAAKLLGNAARSALRQWRPSLERNLVEKANAAILKAGDAKEVRVSLLSLLGKK